MQPFMQLLRKEIYRFMSIWVQTILGPVSTAVLYQLIFGTHWAVLSTGIPHVSYTTYLIPGLVMMQVLATAYANCSSSLIQAKYNGNIVFVLMAPITPGAIYSAYLLASVLRGVIVGGIVLCGIGWFGICIPQHPFMLLYFLLAGAVIMGGFGMLVGILCDKFDQMAGMESFVITPLIYLAGIFFNPHSLSGTWAHIAYLDPFLYIVDGFRYGFIGYASTNLAFGMLFVVVLALIINGSGYMLMKHGVKIKH